MTDMLDKVSVQEAQGVLADLMQKLGGHDGQDWLHSAKRFLRKENPFPAVEAFQPWMIGCLPEGGSEVETWKKFLKMIPLHGTGVPQFDLGDELRPHLRSSKFSSMSIPANSFFKWVKCKVSDLGFVTESQEYNEGDSIPVEQVLQEALKRRLYAVTEFQIVHMVKSFKLYKGESYVFPAHGDKSRLVSLTARQGNGNELQTIQHFPGELYPSSAEIILWMRY